MKSKRLILGIILMIALTTMAIVGCKKRDMGESQTQTTKHIDVEVDNQKCSCECTAK